MTTSKKYWVIKDGADMYWLPTTGVTNTLALAERYTSVEDAATELKKCRDSTDRESRIVGVVPKKTKVKRPNWNTYFLAMAGIAAMRSTCNRKQVGCILVRDNQVLSTGYGGSIRGQPHCTDVGCDIDPKTTGCVRTVHAEVNAVCQAARNGVSTAGAYAYVTLSPCASCFKMLANAGVVKIIYSEEYRIPPDAKLAKECGIELLYHPLAHCE